MVYLATEKIFMKKYHITLKEEAITCGKYSQKDINEKRKQLFLQGYYDDTPMLISDTLLGNNISDHAIEKIVEKYNGYEGPDGYKITKQEVKNFFRQLMCACREKSKCKDLLKGVCILLDKALFINRNFLSQKLESKAGELMPRSKLLHIVPLGSLRDSAKHMAYFWNNVQITDAKIETEKSLEELLRAEDVEQIIFFDDGSYSGTQMISIMQEYMGVKERKTDEHHVKELPDECKKALKDKQVRFFFIAYNKSKEEDMIKELNEIGLANISFHYIEDISIQKLEAGEHTWFENEEQRKLVKKVLQDVGLSIMRSVKMPEGVCKEGWDLERVENAALGYNNAQQMVFLKSSVPTYTITAFWQTGTYNHFEWKPLFRRTTK